MRRPAGVIFAAVVLGFMALMGIFGSLISVATTVFMPNPAFSAVPGVKVVLIVMAGGMLCFFLFCGWTVVGLFRMRSWARYAILAIGGLEFFFSVLMCGVMILMRASPPPMPVTTTPSPVSLSAVFLAMGAFYGFLSLIGAWWLVYFNLKPVRAAFAAAGQAILEPGQAVLTPGLEQPQFVAVQPQTGTPGWRIVIVVWACLILFSALFFPLIFFLHLPLFMFGVVLRGTAATVLMLILLATQVYIAVGLLKRWKAAWYLALVFQVYAIVYFASLLIPGMLARFTAYQQETQARWMNIMNVPSPTITMNPRPFLLLGLVLGVGMVVVLTLALFQRREDYLHA